MKKKIFATALISAMVLSSAFGLASCEVSDPLEGAEIGGNTGMRDFYALSIVSSASYLSETEPTGTSMISSLKATASARPDIVTDSDISGIETCLDLFDEVIAGGGVKEEIKENDSKDPAFGEYSYVMTISFGNVLSGAVPYTFYFNETVSSGVSAPINGVQEKEEITRLEGVAVIDGKSYVVKGEREVEIDDDGTESSVEFITYNNIGGDTPVADMKNYVKIEKSSEQGEHEFEYTFVRGGVTVEEIELEYEVNKNGGIEVSFETETASTDTEIELEKSGADGEFKVVFGKNGKKENIKVYSQPDGSYKLVYSNGYEEYVNKS